MRQSNVIFAALLFAFIVYITVRGQLPAYLALFKGKGSSTASASNTPTSSQGSSSSGSSTSSTIDSALAIYDRISTMRA